ncbi:MAG: general secretion pathway protein GspK [Candidatus Schekmanbacteria bacterium]|nr:general secretion pathway protein GspK [Candidatus Schekmanbacteria bacterium]
MRKIKKDKNKKGTEGFALAIVLLVTTLVVILALEFNYEMRTNASIAANSMDDIKAYYAAKAGIAAGIFGLRADFKSDKDKNSFVDYKGELWATQNIAIPVGEGVTSGIITDEDGKINLNIFLEDEGEDDEEDQSKNKNTKKQGEDRLEQQQNVVKRILDSLPVNSNNSDDIIHVMKEWSGISEEDPALTSYYSNLTVPYESKGNYFDDMTELLLLKGITKEFYFQMPESSDVLQVAAPSSSGGGGTGNTDVVTAGKSLDKLFTVFTPYLDEEEAKININTAPREVLRSLHEDMDDSAVEAIISRQASSDPFKSMDDVKAEPALQNVYDDKPNGPRGIRHLLGMRSYYFRIKATGQVRNASKTIEAVVLRDPEKGSIDIRSWSVY